MHNLENSISIRDEKDNGSIHIILNHIKEIKKISKIEITIFLYPLSTNLNAESFKFLPYEEYVNDLSSGQRSTFTKISSYADKLFGLFIGIVIFLVFFILLPKEIASIESLVSILAAYAIGKEMWIDVDNFLTNISITWRLSWRQADFYYKRQNFGTIQQLWKLAREERYKNSSVLPLKMDFISHSNSKTVELCFTRNDLKSILNDSLYLLNINLKENYTELIQKGYMIGIKLNISQKKLFVNQNTELFQALNDGTIGTISHNKWNKGSALLRKTYNIGKLKYYHSVKLIEKKIIHRINNP